LRFHSNATLNERHYYGYGRAVYKEVTSNELGQLCEKTSRVQTCVIVTDCNLGFVLENQC
jgi:ribosomal protein L30E